ncbi:protein WFDC9 [Castor canadensis]|uniref:Protein WFDC9 n=1 Tax=Castor canadensis TaxID=51338 RepID=A0A8B7UYX2_CASCN|nr:protein WFDC9 [Castor canadensis]
MKLLFLLSITFFYGIGIFLSVLGSLRHRNDRIREVDQCWVQPPLKYCMRRCTRIQSCSTPNYTCCWTFCGNICLDNDEPFKTMMGPMY